MTDIAESLERTDAYLRWWDDAHKPARITPTVVRGGRYYNASGALIRVNADGTGTYELLNRPALTLAATAIRRTLATGEWADGFADNAEYLDNVVCAECGKARSDVVRCDQCDTFDCNVEQFRCDSGGFPDGQNLCDEHTPNHSGCPHCDPVDPDWK